MEEKRIEEEAAAATGEDKLIDRVTEALLESIRILNQEVNDPEKLDKYIHRVQYILENGPASSSSQNTK